MSGMVGLWDFERGQIEPRQLWAMLDRLAHRGPDGFDIWWKDGIGFGHCALWTTPESLHEVMPLQDPMGQFAITADARIDNREELYSLLGLTGSEREEGDGYLILQSYLKWGSRCPEYLLGDFAFAIWDEPQRRLFCARDPMGVKPFYYSYKPGCGFAIASEIKSLLILPWVTTHLNEERITDYLLAEFEDKEHTFYQDVYRLPPATSMLVNVQVGLRQVTYWSLDPSRELHLPSDSDYVDAFRNLFQEAVACRLRSTGPVGSHLSGGLDSSSVTCMAKKIQPKFELHTFSNVFESVHVCDERTYIQAVLEASDYTPHFVVADQLGPLSDSESIYSFHDEAYYGPTHFLVWGLNRAVQQTGIRVILDGFDGDTVLSHGTGWLHELAHQGEWEPFAKEVSALASGSKGQCQLFQTFGAPHLQELARNNHWRSFSSHAQYISKLLSVSLVGLWLRCGLKPLLPDFAKEQWLYWRTGEHSDRWWDHQLFNSVRINNKYLGRQLEKLRQKEALPAVSERQQHAHMLTTGLVPSMLEIIDLSAAACSLEARHPFFDRRLVEFCLALPPQQKLNQGWTRRILRRSMHGILPEKVRLRRSKSNMEPSFTYGLCQVNRKELVEILTSKATDQPEQLSSSFIPTLLDILRRKDGSLNPSETLVTWKISNLLAWHRISRKRYI
ncbi:lasso peptide isopeptide bond-forming cyclase [Synechococcus sp. Nb3U1]|uniref:lasso peptide isopeptide bond-forming cyclase n=1 Tax=Synechococcus sp. Nb3U1 TaxID=1914529 RepID=UPI001F3A39E9|nr:lasso peptide isopeptide bond-forming cyclase [Synechococcus sp. Nb3U1]MCF2969741.1 lasso peptide isopeptide bond-forming cyclase [Synechococcus sp. Nb3U1]